MRNRRTSTLAAMLLILLAALSGCGPEGNRERGAGFGTGADPGNHRGESPQEIAPRSKVFNAEAKP